MTTKQAVKDRRCPKCSKPMRCVSVQQYLINGFVPSGKRYDFRCDGGHTTAVESVGRILRWFAFAAFCLMVFIGTRGDDGAMHWVTGGFGAIMTLVALREVYLRARAPEIRP